MKSKLVIFLIVLSNQFFSQTIHEIMGSDLEKMKFVYLNKEYKIYSTFVYPKVIQQYGGQEKMIESLISNNEKMKKSRFTILNIYFKNFTENILHQNEIQTSFTQIVTIETPQGKINEESTIIGISDDQGKSWKFIDTSSYDKNNISKNFPNLSSNLTIKPKLIKKFEESKLTEKCNEFRNIELQTFSPFNFTYSKIIITETEQKEIEDDESFILSEIRRDQNNPCKLDFVIKEVYNKSLSNFKNGDTAHIELIGFENDELYYKATFNNDKIVTYDNYKIIKKL